MIEEITDWFSELDYNKLGISLLIWAVCMVVLWKLMYDPKIIKLGIRIALSIIMLPLCYFIVYMMSSDR